MMTDNIRLERLGDTDLELAHDAVDVRDRPVFDAAGDEIGTVEALYVDTAERTVRFLQIRSGGVLGLGATETLIPVEAVERIDESGVHIAHNRERIAGAPRYDPDLVKERAYWEGLYGWYGYPVYWGAMHPAALAYPARRRS